MGKLVWWESFNYPAISSMAFLYDKSRMWLIYYMSSEFMVLTECFYWIFILNLTLSQLPKASLCPEVNCQYLRTLKTNLLGRSPHVNSWCWSGLFVMEKSTLILVHIKLHSIGTLFCLQKICELLYTSWTKSQINYYL